jgi:GDP-4-dehydro-6-deoxy-D-mannose reductase
VTAAAYQTLVVTGAAGFLGRHVLELLERADGCPGRVVALDVRPDVRKNPRQRSAGALEERKGGASGEDWGADVVEWVACDLTDGANVRRTLTELAPDGIVHLAGLTAGDDPAAHFRLNVQAAESVLAAAAGLARRPRVLLVGSAAQYGLTGGTREAVDERRPLLGGTPYAVSKTIQERWGLLYHQARGLPVVCVRPFNIMGPRQPEHLVPAAWLRQVRDVLAGRAEELLVGSLTAERDFTDVRDVAAALWSLMRAGPAADGRVFNIASGTPLRIGDLLEACIALGGRHIPVRRDPARLKEVDVPTVVGDASALGGLTGWRPTIPWRQSLTEMWEAMGPLR